MIRRSERRKEKMKRTILRNALAVFGVALLGFGAQGAAAADHCYYKGTMYSDGAAACQAGTQYRCNDGDWKSLGVACNDTRVTLSKTCELGGISYSTGSASCQAGTQYRCDAGNWRNIGGVCQPDLAAPRVIEPVGRTCMLEGSTVSSKSTVCKSGIMYACDDGDWRNLGVPCR